MKFLKPLKILQKVGFNPSVDLALTAVCSKKTRYFTRNNGSNIRDRGISSSSSFCDMNFLKPEPKPKLVVFDLGIIHSLIPLSFAHIDLNIFQSLINVDLVKRHALNGSQSNNMLFHNDSAVKLVILPSPIAS